MSFDLVLLVFIMLIFCIVMQILTIKVMFHLFNSVKPAEAKQIKPFNFFEKKPETKKEEEISTEEMILRNIDAYDGTSFGQEEVK